MADFRVRAATVQARSNLILKQREYHLEPRNWLSTGRRTDTRDNVLIEVLLESAENLRSQ